MGRKTFQSIFDRLGNPLPGRLNIVVTRQADIDLPPGVLCFATLEDAVNAAGEQAEKDGLPEIIIGGGAQIYRQAMAFTDRIYMTEIETDIEGDAWFPVFARSEWKETAREEFPEGENHPPYNFLTLDRA
jgi:dihydrofolate reductase